MKTKNILFKFITAVLLTVMLLSGTPINRTMAAESYKTWMQSDSRWSGNRLGWGSATCGKYGCLLCSIDKLAIQAGLKNDSCTPGVAADGMTAIGGFTDGGALYWAKAVSYFGFSDYSTLKSGGTFSSSDYNNFLIEKVRAGYHLVISVQTKSGSQHWVAVDEGRTLANNRVYIMDSLLNTTNSGITLESRYPYFYNVKGFVGGAISYNTSDTAGNPATNYVSIEEGTYIIRNALDRNYAIDISGASNKNKAAVQVYPYNGTNAQLFNVKHLGDGWYTFSALCGGDKSLDVPSASSESNVALWNYNTNNTSAQRFKIVQGSNGVFLYPECGNFNTVLDWCGGVVAVAPVIAFNYHGGLNQQWILERVDNKTGAPVPVEVSAPAPKTYIVTANSGLNVRTGAGTSYPKVTALRKNTEVTFLDSNSDGSWYYIRSGSSEGWVCATYLRAK